MKIGDRVFVNGYVDEIRKDTVIIRNKGGYFGTVPSEVIETINELPSAEAVHKPDYSYEADMVRRLKEALSAEAVPQLNQTDTLIIADALRYLAKDTERHLSDRTRADALRQQFLKYGASMCKGGDDE